VYRADLELRNKLENPPGGLVGRIQCSDQVPSFLQDGFRFGPEGEFEIKGTGKGKGTLSTCFLTGVHS